MNKPFLILLLVLKLFAFSQNLVPNPSFEEYTLCPTGFSGINDSQIERAIGWYSPTFATPDYFNSCSPVSSGVNVPYTAEGYQNSEGNGYAGIGIFIDPNVGNWFEYIQIKLTDTLAANSLYDLSFDVNLSNNSHYAFRDIGAWITQEEVTSNNTEKLFSTFVQPTVGNTVSFLLDTTTWTAVNGSFKANGTEKFLTVGCFSDLNNLDTLKVLPGELSILSYYYIDNIVLKEIIPEIIMPNVFTPNSDGKNDTLKFKKINGVYNYSVEIFNRWGNQVYFNKNNLAWNGESNIGDPVSEGIYFYKIIYNGDKIQKGFIHLMR